MRKRPTTSTLGDIHISPPSTETPVYGLGTTEVATETRAVKRARPGMVTSCGVPSPKATVRLCLEHIDRGPKINVRGAPDVCRFVRGLGNAAEENFYALHLDVRNNIIDVDHVGKGSSTGVEVHPREVFKSAFLNNASSLIFVHNHPSGNPSPSQADRDLTARLHHIGDIHGITLLDHVVVADGGQCYSFQEHGWLGSGSSGYRPPQT